MQSPIPLSDLQRDQLARYADELARMTRRVNLISPATVREIPERHIAHSLAIAQHAFPAGATVVDWGSGGGLPAVPLAVVFPDVEFVAVDAVGKKMDAVRLFARRLGLENLDAWHGRAEAYDGPAPHYAVSRATAPLADLWGWFTACRRLDAGESLGWTTTDDVWAPGLVCLKGGDLGAEIADLHAAAPQLDIATHELAETLGASWSDKVLLHVTDGA